MKFPSYMMPIWHNNDNLKDEYVDFYPNVEFKSGKNYTLRIVSDTDRAVYLNEKVISFGQYADYPETPVYEDVFLPTVPGDVLKITAWHSGINSQTHVATEAYVAFCLYENGQVVYSSSSETLCRLSPEYIHHRGKIITGQMGAGFALTARTNPAELQKAAVKDINIVSLKGGKISGIV